MALERFTRDHDYVKIDGDIATVGITHHAQSKLGDVVFVELPDVGRIVKAGEPTAVVESVKAASDVFSPLSGEVVEVNGALAEAPALVNEDAEGKAWFFKVRMSAAGEAESLLDRAAYDTYVKEQG